MNIKSKIIDIFNDLNHIIVNQSSYDFHDSFFVFEKTQKRVGEVKDVIKSKDIPQNDKVDILNGLKNINNSMDDITSKYSDYSRREIHTEVCYAMFHLKEIASILDIDLEKKQKV